MSSVRANSGDLTGAVSVGSESVGAGPNPFLPAHEQSPPPAAQETVSLLVTPNSPAVTSASAGPGTSSSADASSVSATGAEMISVTLSSNADGTAAAVSSIPSEVTAHAMLVDLSSPSPSFPFSLLVRCSLAFCSDVGWVFASIRKDNFFPTENDATYREWATQLIASGIAMSFGALAIYALNPKYRTKQGIAVLAMYAFAELVKLIAWNAADLAAAGIAEKNDYSKVESDCMSIAFTAIASVVTQMAIVAAISGGMMYASEHQPCKCTVNGKNWIQSSVSFFAELPGGAAWKFTYLELTNIYGFFTSNAGHVFGASLGVASAVFAATVPAVHYADKFNRWIEQRFFNRGDYGHVGSSVDSAAEMASGSRLSRR